MARQKYYACKLTKTLDCPCGYRIICSTDRERDLKDKLHSRKCDIAGSTNIIKGKTHFHHMNTTPINVAIHKNHEKRSKK